MTLSDRFKNPAALPFSLGMASVGLLSVALVAQYGFGLYPCELCMAQRYPYAAVAALGIAGGMFVKSPRILRYVAIACGLLLALDAGIAVYHAGVEWHIFPGPSACSSNAAAGQTLEEMKAAIMNAQLVPCDQPMAKFFGLSMAAWNALAAAALAGFAFFMLKGRKA